MHSTAHRLGEIRGQVNQVTSDLIFLEAHLEGSQEVPPTNSTGTGDATMIFDLTTNELSWEITFQGLSGPATGAHFHGPAPAGVNAGIQVDIGAISGLNSPMIGSAIISNAQATDLLAGLWYINIHTALFPGGEIRGQVNISP
ncbi:CHRD domain-containing protein [Candidatus Poribacteria bacterium]|nr:CHRD domain-containing protein [Candidatus Poribacteria bacterium]